MNDSLLFPPLSVFTAAATVGMEHNFGSPYPPPFLLPPPASSFAASETQEPAFRSCELVGGEDVSCGIFFLGDTGQVAFCATRNASFVLLTFAWESVQLFFPSKKNRTDPVFGRGTKKTTCNLYLFLFLALQSVWVNPIRFRLRGS